MNHGFYTLLCLLLESFFYRRDAQIRFLREENRIFRSRISSQRLIISLEERIRLLGIGQELRHDVKHLISVVQFRTYQRWVREAREGRRVGRVGRPRKIRADELDQATRYGSAARTC